MTEYMLILVSTVLVNNFVLVQFLGLCPFMSVSRKVETATGMALATTFVLTLSSVSSYLVNEYLLIPLGIERPSHDVLEQLPVSEIMRAQLRTTTELGLLGTGWAVGYIAATMLVPAVVKRVGHVRGYGVLASLAAVSMLGCALIITPLSWIILRTLTGFCFAGAARQAR